jgi:anti-sigma factor RsiW
MSEIRFLGCDALNLYLDGQLDTIASLEFERHLETCADCTRDLADFRAIRGRVQSDLTRYSASDGLRQRIAAAIESPSARPVRKPGNEWLRLAVAASVVAVVSVGATTAWMQPSSDASWTEGIVLAHERAMLAGHEIDVVSSNRHTVKPWFSGKVNMAPLVVDLTDEGFPLIGGRLDVPEGQPVPAIIYGAGKHVICLYMRPMEGETEPVLHKIDGFSILEWRQKGFAFSAVSDADATAVRAFQKAFAPKAEALP